MLFEIVLHQTDCIQYICLFYLSLYGYLYTHSLKTADTGTLVVGGFHQIVNDSGHNKLDNWLECSRLFWKMALDLFKYIVLHISWHFDQTFCVTITLAEKTWKYTYLEYLWKIIYKLCVFLLRFKIFPCPSILLSVWVNKSTEYNR